MPIGVGLPEMHNTSRELHNALVDVVKGKFIGGVMKVKLGELTKIKTGKLDANASSPDGEYPFFTCSKEPLKISSYSYDCECVLVAGNGDLNVKYYNGKFDAYQRTYIIEDNSNGRLYLPYLYYFMNGYVEELRKLSIGGVIKYIKLRNLTDALIELPEIETQKYIVSILSKIKELIDFRYQELKMLENLIKARFVEMFGDPAGKMNNYPKKRFDELCENLDSKRKPITASVRESGNYPYYGASGIVDYVADYIFDEDILLVSEDGANLLMRSTPIAFSVSGKVWVNNHAHVVRFKNIYMQKYIEVYFSMIDISDQITGSAQPKLNQAKLNALEFALPEDALLLKYYDFVAQIDKSKLLSGCRLFHSWAPENRDKPQHVGVPRRKTKDLRGGRRQQ